VRRRLTAFVSYVVVRSTEKENPRIVPDFLAGFSTTTKRHQEEGEVKVGEDAEDGEDGGKEKEGGSTEKEKETEEVSGNARNI
jgi:hypothetical protein